MELSRRRFFSFFGTGVAMLAKPDLFLPKMGVETFGTWEVASWVDATRLDTSNTVDWTLYYVVHAPDFRLAT